MDKIKIDFLRAKYRLGGEKRRPFLFFGRLFAIALVVFATAGVAFSYEIATGGDTGFAGLPHFSIFSTIHHLVAAGDKKLKGEDQDRINFLFMGVGGEGHDGPELTDTIIFASLRPSDKSVGMMSIPRDMTVPIDGYGWRKVNSVNAIGENVEKGSGPALASQVIGNLFGQEIDYYVKVDFGGFAKLIDQIGGVDIYVDRSFTDDAYPTVDDLYQTISFQEGWAHMDGDTALKYVRSRHGNNGEGSDFARSRRQQKVLLAIKQKILNVGTLINPTKVGAIIDTLGSHIQTNITLWEAVRLAGMVHDIDTSTIVNHVLDDSTGSPLYATSLNGAYVLLPKNDDWNPIRQMAANVLYPDGSQVATTEPEPPANMPKLVHVEIQNGTNVTGLAFEASQLLQGQGFDVVKIGNAAQRDFTHTVIYDLTDGRQADELKVLQNYLQADVSMSASGWMFANNVVPKEITVTDDNTQAKPTEDNVDFLVILGQSSADLVRR